MWVSDPDARISGVFNPTATTRRVDGGYMVNGVELDERLPALGLGVPRRAPGRRGRRVRAAGDGADAVLRARDRGHVVHHRDAGDGEQHRTARDVFVPDHRLMSVPGLLTRNYDTPFKDEVLYRSAFIPSRR